MSMTDEVRRMMSTLEDVWQQLNDSWDSRREMLTQLYDLKVRPSLILVECLLVTYKVDVLSLSDVVLYTCSL